MNLRNIIFERKNFYFTCWVFLILSINNKFSDLNFESYEIINIINITRYVTSKLIFFVLIFFFIKYFRIIKINTVHIFFLLFGIILLFSFIYNCFFNTEKVWEEYDLFNLGSYDLSISFISSIIFFIMLNSLNPELTKKIFNIFFLLIFIYIFIIIIPILYNFFFQEAHIFYLYSQETFIADQKTLGQTNQRVTGIARMITILFCFLLFYFSYLINKNKINKFLFKPYIVLAILIFFSFCIWGFQSRGSLILYLIICSIFFVFEKTNLKKKILIFFFIIFIPIISFELTSFYKFTNFQTKEQKFQTKEQKFQTKEINRLMKTFKNIDQLDNSSSGRVSIWKRTLEKSKNKIIFGFGESGDRRALTVTKDKISFATRHLWDNNASNGLLYSIISGGIIAAILFLIIVIKILIYLFKLLIIQGKFKNYTYHEKASITIILLLIIRSFYENGFSQFGIDLLLLLSCLQILIKNYSLK